MDVLLIGAGLLSLDYAKVLQDQQILFKVVGRGIENVEKYRECFPNVDCFHGGIENYLLSHPTPTHAIVVVGVSELYHVTSLLLSLGVQNILLEKPGSLYQDHINHLFQLQTETNAFVVVGYNRRFYQSVENAKNIIQEDGGLISCFFEFTDWTHVTESEGYNKETLAKWVLAHSTHVIDLAFYLCGTPKVWHSIVSGDHVKWHPSGSMFVGCGVTEKGIHFAYHSNWNSPGRWSMEFLTERHRLYFRPMEKLQLQTKRTVKVEEYIADYSIDETYKPGLFNQVKAFFAKDTANLCSLEEHCNHFPFYEKIAGYC
jgi:predicted dehydrogenase